MLTTWMAGRGKYRLSWRCSESRKASTAHAGHGVGEGTCRRHGKRKQLCASGALQDCRVQRQQVSHNGKYLKLRWRNGKTLASVIQESLLRRGVSEIINTHQIQIWNRSPLMLLGAEIFSITFLKSRNHLPSEHEWPWDEEVLSERHVWQDTPFLPVFSQPSCLTRRSCSIRESSLGLGAKAVQSSTSMQPVKHLITDHALLSTQGYKAFTSLKHTVCCYTFPFPSTGMYLFIPSAFQSELAFCRSPRSA